MDDWRQAIDTIHAHGMYIMMDFTVGTMGDLIGFDGCVTMDLPTSSRLRLTDF